MDEKDTILDENIILTLGFYDYSFTSNFIGLNIRY